MKERGEGAAKQDASTRNTKSGRSCINRSESNRPSIHLCVRHSEPRSLVRQRVDLSLQWTYQNKATDNDRRYGTGRAGMMKGRKGLWFDATATQGDKKIQWR